ncbi:MAG: phosphatase PAP2 family protein [Gemmatales bacterium]
MHQSRLILLATVLLILILSYGIHVGATFDVDTYLLRLNRDAAPDYQPLGSIKQQSVIRDITGIGSGVVLTSLTICLGVYHLLRREWRTAWFIMLSILLAWLTMEGLKLVYQRERPSVVPHLTFEKSLSLPSGHSMMSMVVFLTLASVYAQRTLHRSVRVFYFALALLLALVIGYTRVYLGVHHPSDVLAGWLLGVFWVQVSWMVHEGLRLGD